MLYHVVFGGSVVVKADSAKDAEDIAYKQLGYVYAIAKPATESECIGREIAE